MAKAVDTYPTIAAMADMSDYPTPAQWLDCDVRELREAARTMVRLVAMRAFHAPPLPLSGVKLKNELKLEK